MAGPEPRPCQGCGFGDKGPREASSSAPTDGTNTVGPRLGPGHRNRAPATGAERRSRRGPAWQMGQVRSAPPQAGTAAAHPPLAPAVGHPWLANLTSPGPGPRGLCMQAASGGLTQHDVDDVMAASKGVCESMLERAACACVPGSHMGVLAGSGNRPHQPQCMCRPYKFTWHQAGMHAWACLWEARPFGPRV